MGDQNSQLATTSGAGGSGVAGMSIPGGRHGGGVGGKPEGTKQPDSVAEKAWKQDHGTRWLSAFLGQKKKWFQMSPVKS
eukprot:CAMPEP_0197698512 /NCGR_PEP_ID=MMETSP1338-20131121/119435_1 /TAXON_ID=43686 ORGANISM="Pelagodinium beii, Strain RCC1491" /NCGR_SAMPLE_ID=MMETSP1338 /ASSEMBLY_ACC=CAM_ASM_000754 /LENGTH=78 /DNA_ID=CAMNT_0043281917 /DNA_START=1206 /DNA_END=1440 /DNA_ORIENTATION=-